MWNLNWILAPLLMVGVAVAAEPSRAVVMGLVGKATHANQVAGRWLDGQESPATADPAERFRQAGVRHLSAAVDLRTAHALALMKPGAGVTGMFNVAVDAHLAMNARLVQWLEQPPVSLARDVHERCQARLADARRIVADRRGDPRKLP